jgi:cation transport regulator ChaC
VRYFAYGSNLYRAQLKKRAPSARFVATATLPGWRLTFAGWSRGWGGAVATVVKDDSSRVLGAVYDITDPNDVRALDAYEGCPVVYQCRRVTPLRIDGVRRLRCWTYVMLPREVGYPSDQYVKTIASGLREHGLSTDHLIDAISVVAIHKGAAQVRLAKERREAEQRAAAAEAAIEAQRQRIRVVGETRPRDERAGWYEQLYLGEQGGAEW